MTIKHLPSPGGTKPSRPTRFRPISLALLGLTIGLGGCSLLPSRTPVAAPVELPSKLSLLGVRQVWSDKLGADTGGALVPLVSGVSFTVAGTNGQLLSLDARTGKALWRANVQESLSAGVGGDGRLSAVVTRSNVLVVLEAGKEKWRARLPSQTFTPPLVAGGRIFALTAERTVLAFDADNGRKLWDLARAPEPLALRQSGVLLAVGDVLVTGVAGRFVAIDPDNGRLLWDAPLATPRGANDVERLVDLVGGVSRLNNQVCARAFQSAVGCVDARRGTLAWTHSANGVQGVHGDEELLLGTESNGMLIAWNRLDGKQRWASDRFKLRKLTAPLVLGRSVVVGDQTGAVYFVSREDGSLLNKVVLDSSGIAFAPVNVDETLVMVTRNGGIHAFRPD